MEKTDSHAGRFFFLKNQTFFKVLFRCVALLRTFTDAGQTKENGFLTAAKQTGRPD
jgi:hypothetical protein